jgi:hypothetical protein
MRTSVITALTALGLAGVLFAPMTANAASFYSPHFAAGSDGDWDRVKEFKNLNKCLEEADKIEDTKDADAVCLPENDGEWVLWIQRHRNSH